MAFGDLTNKLELAAVALLAANPVAGVVGFTGQSGATQSRPAFVAIAEQGDEFPQGAGNFHMELRLRILSNADDVTLAQHRANVASIADVFRDTDTAANLSAQQSDFTAFGIQNVRYAGNEESERQFISELMLTVYCCASDIS